MNTAATLPTPSPLHLVPISERLTEEQLRFMRFHAALDVTEWRVVDARGVIAATDSGWRCGIRFSELDDLCERGFMTQHGSGRFDVSLTDAGREAAR